MAPKKKVALTRKQERVRDYIFQCIEREQRPPTIRQIGVKFGLKSTGSVRDVLAALIKKREIIRDPALSRGIRLNPRKYKVKILKVRG